MKLNYKIILILLTILIWFVNRSKAQDRALTLESAVNLSLEKNRELKVSELESAKAAEKVKESRSYIMPNLNLTGQYFYFFQKQVSFLPGSFVGLSENQLAPIRVGGDHAFISSVNLTQPLYSPNITSNIRASRIYEQIEGKNHLKLKAKVIAEVKKAYLDVLIIQEQLRLLKQSISRNEQALKDSRSLLAQGRASRIDTLRAYVTVENLKPEVIRLTNGIEIAETLLKRAIGLEASEVLQLTDSLKTTKLLASTTREDAFTEAIEARPEITALKLTEKLNKEIIYREYSNHLPNLLMTGSFQVQSQSNDFRMSEYNWPASSFVGLQLNVPLLSGFRTVSKVRQARITSLQTEKQLEDMKEIVRSEVTVSFSQVEEARRRIEVQEQTVAAAELGFRITNDRWKQGISSRLELADAELSLTSAKSNYLQAIYDYLISVVMLEKALGKVEG